MVCPSQENRFPGGHARSARSAAVPCVSTSTFPLSTSGTGHCPCATWDLGQDAKSRSTIEHCVLRECVCLSTWSCASKKGLRISACHAAAVLRLISVCLSGAGLQQLQCCCCCSLLLWGELPYPFLARRGAGSTPWGCKGVGQPGHGPAQAWLISGSTQLLRAKVLKSPQTN